MAIIEDKILMINSNHVIFDGYSYYILINELIKIYNSEALDPLLIQFSDFAIYYDEQYRLNQYTDKINYYKKIFNVLFNVLFNIIKLSHRKTDDNTAFVFDNRLLKRYKLITIILLMFSYHAVK